MCLGLLGRNATAGQLCTAEELCELVAGGHEIGCHTFSHMDAWTSGPRKFEASLTANAAAATKLLGLRLKSFSYPYSPPNPWNKKICGKVFSSARGGQAKANIAVADLNYLSAVFLERVKCRLEVLWHEAELAKREAGWLILASHDVSDQPSRFGISKELFVTILERLMKMEFRLLPVGSVVEELERDRRNKP